MDKTFNIDFFELSFLAEACIPPRPIARAMFWKDLINKHYHNMTDSQREKLYTWITGNAFWKPEEPDCILFANRFNPANQYTVHLKYEGQEDVKDAFLHEGKYHVAEGTWIQEEYITDKYPKNAF